MTQPKLLNVDDYVQLSFCADGRISRQSQDALRARERKWCSRCRQVLPFDDFCNNSKTKDGKTVYCRKCRHSYARPHTKKRAPKLQAQYEERKQELVKLLGGKCIRCGYREFVAALDFHHVAPEAKVTEVSGLLATSTNNTADWDTILAELDKCALLCSNCHKSFSFWGKSIEWEKRVTIGWRIKLK